MDEVAHLRNTLFNIADDPLTPAHIKRLANSALNRSRSSDGSEQQPSKPLVAMEKHGGEKAAAQALGWKQGTLKSRLHRGRHSLARLAVQADMEQSNGE